jgi:hypothetical protein
MINALGPFSSTKLINDCKLPSFHSKSDSEIVPQVLLSIGGKYMSVFGGGGPSISSLYKQEKKSSGVVIIKRLGSFIVF